MEKQLHEKYALLLSNLKSLDSAIVAFSAGVDSSFLLFAAKQALGKKALAVTADSESLPRHELKQAKSLAKSIGAEHLIVQTKELSNSDYTANTKDRCYHCKNELFINLAKIAKERKFKNLIYGLNSDDIGDFRPGMRAAEELFVKAPLAEANLSKKEIRELCQEFNLSVAEKPASPCLSSRIPYGMQVTKEKLQQIEKAENFLRSLGFKELRVRHFNQEAKIEVPVDEIAKLKPQINKISKKFNSIGFSKTTINPKGFRSGNLNELIQIK